MSGSEDFLVVYFAYNRGVDTWFYRSTDGGRTWGLPLLKAGYGLADLGQGPENDHLYLTGEMDGKLVFQETTDGGSTWSDVADVPMPTAKGFVLDRRVPVADEAGNLWVVYAYGEKGMFGVYAARRDAAGAWNGPFEVSPPGGTHALPWPAALKDGTLVVAWYAAPWANVTEYPGGALGDPYHDVAEDDAWYLMVAATLDGTAATPTFQHVVADPDPVAEGPLGRRLLDFLQVDVSPDGAVHVAYAADRYDGPEHTLYVRSTTGLALAPATFPFGPGAAPAHGHGVDLSTPRSVT